MNAASKVLLRAAEMIEAAPRLLKGQAIRYHDDGRHSYCLTGAIGYASKDVKAGDHARTEALFLLRDALGPVVLGQPNWPAWDIQQINDSRLGFGKREAIAALREAANA